MSLPLIRARRKPRFGLPWLALLLGTATAAFGLQGLSVMTATKTSQLEIVLEGTAHPYGISAESLATALPQPIATWRPLRLIVSERYLRSEERRGQQDVGADVLLSTHVLNMADPSDPNGTLLPENRFAGAGVNQARGHDAAALAKDIAAAYQDNVVLGHGPKAVAAAAERAVQLLDEAPYQNLLFWLLGTIVGLALTIAALAVSLSRRRRRQQLFQRLSAAQSRLAAVVLELEALEASYAASQRHGATQGIGTTWADIRRDSLELARTEDAAMAAVYSARSALRSETESMVASFEDSASILLRKAEALHGASAIWGALTGSRKVLEELAAPVALAARELLAQLEERPAGVLAEHRIRWLARSLDALLDVPGSGTGGADTVTAWRKAEQELLRSLNATARTLVKRVRGQVPQPPPPTEDFRQLRKSLGLPPDVSCAVLTAIATAQSALPMVIDTQFRAAPVAAAKSRPQLPPLSLMDLLREKSSIYVGLGFILVLSFLLSLTIVGFTDEPRTQQAQSNGPPASLVFDGHTSAMDTALIEERVQAAFSQPVHITVAVRDAYEYLDVLGDVSGYGSFQEQDPEKFLMALWRIKGEFAQLHDEQGIELRPDQAIVPVFSDSFGRLSSPTVLTGVSAQGNMALFSDSSWKRGRFFFTNNGDYDVAHSIQNLGRGLQINNDNPAVSGRAKLLLLTVVIALSLTLLALALIYGSAMSARLGRFGVKSAQHRLAGQELDRLLLGLDETRINAIAILGAGPAANSAETGQRIFEGALAVACRMRDSLAAASLARRLTADYAAHVTRFADLVSVLTSADTDVERRSQKLLADSLGSTRQR